MEVGDCPSLTVNERELFFFYATFLTLGIRVTRVRVRACVRACENDEQCRGGFRRFTTKLRGIIGKHTLRDGTRKYARDIQSHTALRESSDSIIRIVLATAVG